MGEEIPGRRKSRAKALGQEWCIRGTARRPEWLQQREAGERVGDEADVDVMGHCLDLAFTLWPGSPGAFEQRRDVMYVENWLKGQRRN